MTLSKRLQSPMQEDDDYKRIRVCKEEGGGGCLGVARQEVGEYLSSERGKHLHSSFLLLISFILFYCVE